jgi:hypothetical protein
MLERLPKSASAVLLCAFVLAAASGCASGKLDHARNAFYDGRLARAAEVLEEPGGIAGRDRLLFFMEKGVVEHHRGEYEASTRLFRRAVALIDELSIISASRQAGSLVTSERLTRYRGEYAERLWVHTYLMMNYLLLGRTEGALVEAKQALEVFDAYPQALKKAFFTRALIAHCFEAAGEANGAFIEYEKLAKALPDPTPVADKLVFLAGRLGFSDAEKKYGKLLTRIRRLEVEAQGAAGPEFLFFVHQGRAPVKIPRNIIVPPSIRFSFVTYGKHGRGCPRPAVYGRQGTEPAPLVKTVLADALNDSLEERIARMLAKETARVAAKEAIAHNIEDEFLALVVRGVFFVLQEPDTRCWQTLPACWGLLRIPLQKSEQTPALTIAASGIRYDIPGMEPQKRYTYFVIRQEGRGGAW